MTSVLIGIPTLNGPDRLHRCLASIGEYTFYKAFPDIKVLVCDDGSTPSNLDANKSVIHQCENMRNLWGLEMLMHPVRKGIASGWNDLTRHKRADVVVLINDDIEVVPHWLEALVHSVTRNKQIGMCSLNSYVSLTAAQHRTAIASQPPHVNVPRIDYHESKLMTGGGTLLTSLGSIFAFRQDVYYEAGGFDERFRCFYEEVDFGCTLRSKGYIHAIASYPVVYHMGGATTSDPKNMDAAAEIEQSRALFKSKWGTTPNDLRGKFTAGAQASGVLNDLNEWNTQLTCLSE
jgi:GT2 family glycosyltransferase